VLTRLLNLFTVIRRGYQDPRCACCERGLFIGGHVCPPAVVAAREARQLVAAIREIR